MPVVRSVSLVALVLAALLALSPAIAPGRAAAQDPDEPHASYPFLQSRDPVAVAMATLWRQQFQSHATRDAAARALQQRADAEAIVRADLERAAAHLLEAFRVLSERDAGGYVSLQPLLRIVGSHPEVLRHLHGMLMSEAPAERTAAFAGKRSSHPTEQFTIPPGEQVRRVALKQIVRAAEERSSLARGQLFELLRSPDAKVRVGAVQGLYRIHVTREQAQRAMRTRLAPEEHYLLYRY